MLRRRPGLLRHPAVRSILIGAATLGLMYLSTRFHWSILLFGLAPLLPRLWGAFNRAQAARGPTPGSTSRVEAEWLRMSIDHDTGKLDGEVLNGAFQGRTLDSLAPGDLLALLAECRRNDPESARLLEAYLDRRLGGDWRGGEANEGAAGGPRGAGAAEVPMTVPQALQILGSRPVPRAKRSWTPTGASSRSCIRTGGGRAIWRPRSTGQRTSCSVRKVRTRRSRGGCGAPSSRPW